MSVSQISELNTPSKSVFTRNKRKNKVRSPPDRSPKKPGDDVYELFTIKTCPRPASNASQDTTTELSDDVFVKPKPVVSTPSTTKSYRDRINERFKTVKEKAGKSTKKANVFKEATEKLLLEKVRKESSDIDAELEAVRNRLRLGTKVEDRNELHDFFCVEKCQTALENETEDEDNVKSTENLTEDVTEMTYSMPKQMSSTLRDSEEALLFQAKAQLVDMDDKIEAEEEPRRLEDEGFYVPPPPRIPTRHVYLLEQRLSRDTKKWFNCEGKLSILENPCQKTSYRPSVKQPPLEEVATFIQPSVESQECEEIIVVRENLLQLQISTLKFTHHPLFSLEHVFEAKLRRLYEEYEENELKNDVKRLSSRVEGLRRILKRLEETSSQSGEVSDKEDEKAEAYRRDIKILQNKLFEEGKKERDRIKAILDTWKAIKKIRESNKYSSTRIKLVIRKEKVDYESEKEIFERNFEDVFEETLLEQRQRSKRKKYNEEEIKEDLLERFRESFRMPGEPILHFALTNDNEITNNVENSKENTRRNAVASTKIILKITCNKIEVCKTKPSSLQNDFTCHFDETISMQLITVPKFLTVEVIEQPRSLIKKTIGELTIKIPSRTTSKSDLKSAKFENNAIVHYKHEGVGSGIKIADLVQDFDDEEKLKTAGSLLYSLKWDRPINRVGKNNEDHGRQIIDEIIDKNGSIDTEKLSQWIHQHKPDPQDPKNSILYECSLDSDEENNFLTTISEKKNKCFRLSPHLENWQFCDPKIIEENLRLKVLKLRNRNEPEFDRMAVPNRIKEIPLDILNDYKRRIASEKETLLIEDDDFDEEEIEKRRSRGRKLLKQIHIRVFQKCKNSENNLTFEDVVDEKFLHHFEKLIKDTVINFISWFRWRPLRPPLTEDDKTPSQDSKLNDYHLKTQAKVVVTVISALNLPERVEGQITPFVEIEYHGVTARTSTSEGPHPSWNEKLSLPLEPTHLDYLNPHSLNGTLTVNIFDEDEKILLKFPGIKSKNWLGCLEIPLSAICFGGIQGMFKVKGPQILLGYKDKDKSAKLNQTYVNLHVTIEPNIPKLSPSIEELPCADVPYIKEHALRWNEEYNLNFPNRKFSVFAIDTNATTTCIVRYIKPLEPPQINVEGFDVTPDQCVRYVSLIPFSNCNQFYKNIWLSVDRFLHFMIGSIIDHAVALTCYLLALKLEVWLLLGFGVPYGFTAFVLRKEHDSNQTPVYYIYDVVHGDKINITDPFCPLQKIYCVVNENNVWGNIQRNDDVATTRFDFTRKSDWSALFDNKVSAPTNTIHGKLTYLPKPQISELEIIIDRKIRKKIAKLRQLDRTIWNHQISNEFKSVLSAYEKNEMYGKSNADALEKVKECMANYKIRGLLFNSPFMDISSIVNKVKSFGLHLEEGDSTQFASAVYLKAYPNQVLAVWIFLASIKTTK